MSMLTAPPHIRTSGALGWPADHGIKSTADFEVENPKLAARLVQMSVSARLAFAIGAAEWTMWRFEGMSDFDAPLQMVTAAWAGSVDIRYVAMPPEAEFEERRGPVDGVLLAAMELVEDALRSYDTPRAQHLFHVAVYSYQLAKLVSPDRKPFDAWVRMVVARLVELYPADEADIKGEPVPREVLDTTTEFERGSEREHLARFLGELVPSENRYLRTPDELIAAGFEGTPYRLP
ncbi:hypothetical protein [Homoserinibacter sp. YIM 151385]|uniref:hypothetical protein n=1 Tax=Homoserinibacter sp. YIM 151385 TaxID=2985506 RepID=UPI0022F0FBA4|nr:hypothetical protein [Homoserinibacter sp. YIM 151385]WBU38644.1 hypothetical protein OF852_03390 [Homoserinibacter sp. YIM 151385]